MKIMLTGANGQIGWELVRSLMPLGEVVALTREQCDLSQPEKVPAIVQEIKPDVIVNAAAYTAVDKAEEEEALATIINGTTVGVLAEEAKKYNALLIHYSTDYVFDGLKTTPYTEEDRPNPINAYGRSKLVGEQRLRDVDADYLIFRTSWVYSEKGHNFVNTILRLVREKDELHIVSDQFGSPTWARNISDVTAHVILEAQRARTRGKFHSGIYNLCSSGRTSWYDFAQEIVNLAEDKKILDRKHGACIMPISSDSYYSSALRPKSSLINPEKLRLEYQLMLPDWLYILKSCFTMSGSNEDGLLSEK